MKKIFSIYDINRIWYYGKLVYILLNGKKSKGYNNSPTIFNYITGKIDKIEDDVLIVSGKWDKIQQKHIR